MDQRMMDAGGAKKREELFKLFNVSQLSSGLDSINLNGYSEEEKKVMMYGEKAKVNTFQMRKEGANDH